MLDKIRPIATCFVLMMFAHAALGASPPFEADDKLETNARKWAEEFITFAKERYEIDLDWSDVSIKYLDDIAASIHETYVAESPPDEMVIPLARAMGSYLGEVYRITNGGRWGWVNLEDGSFPGIESVKGATFLPLKRAVDRIKLGAEYDLWEYFQLVKMQ